MEWIAEALGWTRIALYGLTALILFFTASSQKKTRRWKNTALSAYFAVVATAVVSRFIFTVDYQSRITDYVLTPVLVAFFVLLCMDFVRTARRP